MSDPIFVNGLRFFRPHEKAPDFIKGNISISVPDLLLWIEQHRSDAQPDKDGKGEFLKIDLKESKEGKLYFQLNNWKPSTPSAVSAPTEKVEYPADEINSDDIPF